MPRARTSALPQYIDELKRTAARMSQHPGVMGKAVAAALLIATITACGRADKAPSPEQSAPSRVRNAPPIDTLWLFAALPMGDAVHAGDTDVSLFQRFGGNNVSAEWLQNGEGDSTYGTVLFARDSARRIAIRWTDATGGRRVETAEIMGHTSQWHVFPGVTLGMRLTELERINGRPFNLTGFDWDYAGGITDWGGGHLDSVWVHAPNTASPVRISLAPDDTGHVSDADSVSGDHSFSSAFPPMRRLNPRIARIAVRAR